MMKNYQKMILQTAKTQLQRRQIIMVQMRSLGSVQSRLSAPALSPLSSPSCPHQYHHLIDDDWEATRDGILRALNEPERNSMAYALAFSQETSNTADNLVPQPTDYMTEQLKHSEGQLLHSVNNNSNKVIDGVQQTNDEPLPRTFEDAIRHSNRAIVITETQRPFPIVDVNKAWEGLCGYSYVESKGKSLGKLLQGPDTDPVAVTGMLSQLMQGNEAGVVLVNYKKCGRKFNNRLTVGPLYNEQNEVTHFVGVLQEV